MAASGVVALWSRSIKGVDITAAFARAKPTSSREALAHRSGGTSRHDFDPIDAAPHDDGYVETELGTMIARAGLLTAEQVRASLDRAEAGGIHLIEALTDMDLVSEADLADFAHRRLLIPLVSDAVLARVAPAVARSISSALARGRVVLPISTDAADNLTLAMADPTDAETATAVGTATGRFVIRAAAPLGSLRRAIERCFGETSPGPTGPARRAAEMTPSSTAVGPATEPDFAEIVRPVLRQLAEAVDRDAVLELIVTCLSQGFGRVAAMVHTHGELRLRAQRGALDLAADRSPWRLPVRTASLFARVLADGHPYFGPLPQTDPTERQFAQAMGGVSGNMLLLPIRAATSTPLIVFAHPATCPVDRRAIDQLAEATGRAIVRLLRGSSRFETT
ncbi:MAG: hypothetical protein B7733_12170 [Myxococcales bacterium FL481]|nr:MAG: hypothetical protein B7733_12170 [Myxococcales bacterium FL481]